jgi:hypothetical protein
MSSFTVGAEAAPQALALRNIAERTTEAGDIWGVDVDHP